MTKFADAVDVIAQALATALRPMIAEVVRDVFVEFHQAEPPRKLLYDANEVGAAIDASRSTIYKLVEQGLPYVLVGDTRKFDLDEVVAWLKARTPERKPMPHAEKLSASAQATAEDFAELRARRRRRAHRNG